MSDSLPTFSFEFFPPKTPALEAGLWQAVDALAPLAPLFVSVTYGAGGGTRSRTHEIVARLQGERGLTAAAHLTCVGASRAEVNEIAAAYWRAGIRHIVALRGDPPAGTGTPYVPHPDGYAYAVDLVAALRALHPFELSVAAYPETHPAAHSPQADLDNLKRKIDAGATRAITQFFFDNSAFFRFRDRAAAAGITAPIVPGILPVGNFSRVLDFARRCGASIPADYHRLFAGHDTAPTYIRQQVAVEIAVEQCLELQASGVSHFHFYTLNRADLVAAICSQLRSAGSGETLTAAQAVQS